MHSKYADNSAVKIIVLKLLYALFLDVTLIIQEILERSFRAFKLHLFLIRDN